MELLDTGAESDTVARRASEQLERAAKGGLGRSDLAAAIGLFERAASLPPVPERRRARLLTDLAATLMDSGRLADAEHVLADAQSLASTADDETRARLRVECQFLDCGAPCPARRRVPRRSPPK